MKSIFTRRSIRKFENKSVEQDKIESVLKAAMQAPSAGDQRPWEFIVVKEKNMLKKISEMSPYAKFLEQAPMAIVMVADKEKMLYPENWEQDMGAATENLLLQAVDEELGTVWLGVAPLQDRMDHISKIFGLSSNILPYNVIAMGYPTANQQNRYIDRFEENRIHYEKW